MFLYTRQFWIKKDNVAFFFHQKKVKTMQYYNIVVKLMIFNITKYLCRKHWIIVFNCSTWLSCSFSIDALLSALLINFLCVRISYIPLPITDFLICLSSSLKSRLLLYYNYYTVIMYYYNHVLFYCIDHTALRS